METEQPRAAQKNRAAHQNRPLEIDTLVVGGGQAGLATSYFLSRAGVEHLVLERRAALGGAWQDRWDAFVLNTPNFSLDLPGMPYTGPEPEAFMARDDAVNYFRDYARRIDAPVRTGTDVTRISTSDGGFSVETSDGGWRARNVVLATGAYQIPKIPALAAGLPGSVLQLHTHDYRNPEQLPDGAVLIVGTGQSGGQIAEDLLAAGREVHLAVSMCPEAPRRYRGHDTIYWILQAGIYGPEYGVNALTVGQLPSPAARFACNPLLSGTDGGHDIHLRELGRQGIRLHGHLEAADDGELTFTDDLPERLATVEAGFGQRMGRALDAYIASAGIDAPEQQPAPADDWLPVASPARVNLAAENITSVLWATGYKLDLGFVDIPVLDAWSYPRQVRGVTECPGLYVVGLPWLTGHYSSIVGGVGVDAEYVAGQVAGR
ncbi:flavin-containing monooxygenase [Arthrobacter sp. FW306-2-2C-D06B]|uniref:flavin-containing monooxygenase n=1 Tax=Arthrobacter sp. FW306-2-2C-D06B TaxID=2879618 RepID=UPI001F3CC0F2|nr:NAD(P)/FAD-dependent oxidoreductase [Arthrobacter sp. FW306-2-2C-D06B]UKA59815.1 NAD(P)/FAD-dependent oxidoreductase [Arthrobacter sp. FW306-2-2C-D06B]